MTIKINLALIFCLVLIALQSCTTSNTEKSNIDQYNVVWDTQSINSSESMPVVGGDIACNVWVENGDLLFYMSRSGSFDENGIYCKLGRVRVKLTPNPFDNNTIFRQELKLHDGFIEIEGRTTEKEDPFKAKMKVWIEVHNPVIHVDITGSTFSVVLPSISIKPS
jgi:hypothetical protein